MRIEELKSSVNKIDERVTNVEKDVAVMRQRESSMQALVQQTVDAYNKLDDTMTEVSKTMVEVNLTLGNMNNKIEGVQNNAKALESEIQGIKEERNVNIVEWLRDHWVELAVAGVVIGELIKNGII